MLKVLSLSIITPNRRTSLKKEIMNLLDANIGDEILFILDKNGIINIRKFKGDMTLGTGEKYISSSYITRHKTQTHTNATVTITGDVRHIVNADIGDKILWILDNDGNIIIRNNVILNGCSINIFSKDITALVIGMSSLMYQNNIVAIPKEITDILGVYEEYKIMLSLDNYGNIIVSKEIGENLLQESTINNRYPNIYIINTVIDILEAVDKILWYFDEEGNIIIKNNLLPDNCISIAKAIT